MAWCLVWQQRSPDKPSGCFTTLSSNAAVFWDVWRLKKLYCGTLYPQENLLMYLSWWVKLSPNIYIHHTSALLKHTEIHSSLSYRAGHGSSGLSAPGQTFIVPMARMSLVFKSEALSSCQVESVPFINVSTKMTSWDCLHRSRTTCDYSCQVHCVQEK